MRTKNAPVQEERKVRFEEEEKIEEPNQIIPQPEQITLNLSYKQARDLKKKEQQFKS